MNQTEVDNYIQKYNYSLTDQSRNILTTIHGSRVARVYMCDNSDIFYTNIDIDIDIYIYI